MQYLEIRDKEVFHDILSSTGNITVNWRRSASDYEKQIQQFCFEYVGNELPKAKLWVMEEVNNFKVTNIVPIEKFQLEPDEYNSLLLSFADDILKGHTDFVITPENPNVDVEFYMGKEAKRALEQFSSMANKGTGTGHPSDQRRWFEFIKIGVLENKLAPVDLIREFLLQDGWSEGRVEQLCFEYEYTIDVMKFCFN
jgi:hypothetical protein